MKPPLKIAIIGCGGIACHLVPALSRQSELVLVDGDSYEEANIPRQFAAMHSTGNKAEALMELCQPHTTLQIQAIPEFLRDARVTVDPAWKGVDLIIGAVDNNRSRELIIELARDLEIPAILAGNEHEHGEAHLFVPNVYNPFDHFDFGKGEPPPWACNHAKTLEEFPQTAVANILAAGAVHHLLLAWGHVSNPLNAVAHSRTEPLANSSSRIRELLAAAKA